MGQVISTVLSWLRALKKGKGRQNERIFPVTPRSKDVSLLWQQNSQSFLDSFTEDFRINVKDLRKQKVEEIIRRKGPYTSSQKILLVGEGDFSFSACLAVSFGSAANMVATSLDSTEFLLENYQKAKSNIHKLRSRGCMVMHEVDATQMASCYPLNTIKFDRIIFNFPHAGVFRRDAPRNASICEHQKLIRRFLKNAKKMIAADGEIHITHKSNGFFRQWAIEMLAANEGLRLNEAFRFNYRDYDGYSTKFGFGGDGFFNCNPSKTYIFASA